MTKCFLILIPILILESSYILPLEAFQENPWSSAQLEKRAIIKSMLDLMAGALTISGVLINQVTASSSPRILPDSSKMELGEAANFIKLYCKTILDASQATGHLLYRGSESLAGPALICPGPDLLLKGTYPPLGTDFFSYIDNAMRNISKFEVSPINGHIATSDIIEASEWGTPVSVWPIDTFHYAWLKNDNTWWNDEWSVPQGPRGPLFWHDEISLENFIRNEMRYDNGLEGALAKGAEIMFTSTGRGSSTILPNKYIFNSKCPQYLAIPLSMEPQLMSLLDIKPYSKSVKITIGPPIEVDNNGLMKKRLDKLDIFINNVLSSPTSANIRTERRL